MPELLMEMSIPTLVWLFIVAFLIHDLEEIIWVGPWIEKNRTDVIKKVPGFMKKRLENLFQINSSQFAVAVLLELIVFIPFTFMAAGQGKFLVFLAFNSLFFIHVFTHLGQSIYLRRYTPGVVTAVIITLPYGLFLFYRLLSDGLVSWSQVLLSIPLGLLMLPVVLVGHKLGKKDVK